MSDDSSLIDPVARAASIVGGVKRLAELLGVKHNTFYQWQRVPPDRVLAIETATDGQVTRHQMRPDLYPAEVAEPQGAAA